MQKYSEQIRTKSVRLSFCVIFLVFVDIPHKFTGKDFLLLLSVSAHYL